VRCASDAASTTDRVRTFSVAVMQRQCSRTGCADTALFTLSYQYARSVAWLDDLLAERDPHSYDLCQRHTMRLSVPNGWRLEDRRSRRELVVAAGARLAG
jgi:hypothetical protein